MPTPSPVPVIGSDDGTWGSILNQFLAYSFDVTNGQLLTGTTNQNYTNYPSLYPNAGWSTNPNYAQTSTPGIVALAGDLGGTSTSAATPKVSGLQGVPVSATAPSPGQILQDVSGTWTPTTYGGDVSGSPRSSTVIAIQGVAVSATAPGNGQVLEYNGTNWIPTNITSGTQRTFAFFAS